MSNPNEIPDIRPEHHIHDSAEPLPGQPGAAPTADYSTSAMERAPVSATDTENTSSHCARSTGSQNACDYQRPPGVPPASEGGVAVSGESQLPIGHATFSDKIIGKTQKAVGKYTNKPEMLEKGELREAGGKAAVLGDARVPHD